MKLLLVTNDFPPRPGGIQSFLHGLVSRLPPQDVVVYTSRWREWEAWVGFTPVRLKRSLLGFAGFLQYFTAAFHGDREEVELTVNRLYPGT